MGSAVRIIAGVCLSLFSLGLLLPTGIAIARNHPETVSIAVWNTVGLLLFGLGWLIALVKALTDGGGQQSIIIQNVVNSPNSSTEVHGRPRHRYDS